MLLKKQCVSVSIYSLWKISCFLGFFIVLISVEIFWGTSNFTLSKSKVKCNNTLVLKFKTKLEITY